MSAFGVNPHFMASDTKRVPHINGNAAAFSDSRKSANGQGHRKNNGDKSHKGGKPQSRSAPRPKKPDSPPSDEPAPPPPKVLSRQAPEKLQNYSPQDIQQGGPVYANPQALGFRQSSRQKARRPVPKYLIHQSRLLYTPPFVVNAWDKQNQQKMLNMEQANSGLDYQGIYEEFQKMREFERKQMEQLGLVDAMDIRKDLNDAILFQGSCEDMCPIFERVRRSLENNVKALEKDPSTFKISRAKAVKAFSRPAAGQPPPLPSEVRPPHILQKTLDYLVDNIIEKLPEAHSFIWDRTRSIRQDFTYQNSFGPEAIDCNERIVRIHLLSLHIMANSHQEYSQQQELEQFNKALQTLIEIYQDIRNHGGGNSPNEAEFRSYYLLSHLRNPELDQEIQALPMAIFKDPHVQLALKLRNIVSQNNLFERGGFNNSPGSLNLFEEFFKIIYSPETPLLMACLLETHFNEVRFYALKSMARSFHTKGRPYPAESLKNLLGFDSIEKLVKFVTYYEVDVIEDNGEVLIDLFNKEKLETKYKLNSIHDKPKLAQAYSHQLDSKIGGRSLKDFINLGKTGSTFVQVPHNVPASLPIMSQEPIQKSDTFGSMPTNSFGSMPSSSFGSTSSSTFKPTAPTNFGSTTPSFGVSTQQQPSINLGPSIKPAVSSALPPTSSSASTPAFKFQELPKSVSFTPKVSTQEPKSSQTQPALNLLNSRMPSINPEPKQFGFQQQTMPNTDKVNLAKSLTIPDNVIPKIEEFKGTVTTAPKHLSPPPPTKKKITDSPHFQKAAQSIVSELISKSIQEELASMLPKLVNFHKVRQEKRQVISSLASQLYDAFLSEIIFKSTLEIKADNLYQHNLKLYAIRKIKNTGQIAIQRQQTKRKKLEELNSISFKKPTIKRSLSSANISTSSITSSKRRQMFNTSNTSVPSIDERQREIERLWAPINLQNFVTSCSESVKLDIISKAAEIDLLLVVENWTSPYSKWLNTKLSLHTNIDKRIYENVVKNDKMILNIKSLPGNDYLTKEFFAGTGFIVFESGLTNEDSRYPTVQDKLDKDQKILNKIVSLVDKFSYYKVQILVLYWDITQASLGTEEVKSALNLKGLSTNENIKNVVLCDMTTEEKNINEILVEGFDNLKENFNGEFSKRGLKKQEKLLKIKSLNEKKVQPVKKTITDETFKANETLMINKVKRSQKYDYLNNHLTPSSNSFINKRGPNSSLRGINASMDSSQYTIAQNRSIIPHLTSIHRNNSFLSNFNSTASSINNVSTLTGFGKGVLEESTPSSSPSRSKLGGIKKPLPKSVQQLRDLTAGIKAKYKKQ
ncbi:mRNA export factor Sac3 [Suhomyces tanzawaensis NRRL Y-17324]|uniref:Nuclear mRNA export factor n=1 Tax=Suhomyces tanzawaensis NRRL Y-17324 TaxID=984487 RepID=A0A1E4SJY9_9ASCO|nr:mRNA export factor Sac3 [Suhomyces tanzawaensis NRRL Y-17324]ODV79752.1 mRNA export factor Sac3 [Suhomyces tanzawaensis NRRL Y-17324]